MWALTVDFLGGVKVFPLASTLQVGASPSSSSIGVIRRIFPSFTWTKTTPPFVLLVKRRTPPPTSMPYSAPTVASMLRVSESQTTSSSAPIVSTWKVFAALTRSS